MKRSLNMILQTKNKNPPISIKGIENRPIKKQILDAWKYCKFNRCVRVITSGWKFRKLTLETTSKLYFYNMLKGQDSWYSISQANANRQGLILSQPRRWQVHKMFKQWQGHKNVKIYSKKTNLDAAYSLILPTKASKKYKHRHGCLSWTEYIKIIISPYNPVEHLPRRKEPMENSIPHMNVNSSQFNKQNINHHIPQNLQLEQSSLLH